MDLGGFRVQKDLCSNSFSPKRELFEFESKGGALGFSILIVILRLAPVRIALGGSPWCDTIRVENHGSQKGGGSQKVSGF